LKWRKKDGKAAVAAVIARRRGAGRRAARHADAGDQAEPHDSEQERVETAIKHDRRGRPPGAQNKTTREMLEFVRKLCGDPLERRFRYAMHTPETLAIELGCTKLEAFDRLTSYGRICRGTSTRSRRRSTARATRSRLG
jgi:hypothetical protein